MSDQPETLTISVADDVKTKDVPPGGTSNNLPEYFQQAIKRCVPAHNVKSRWVTEADIPFMVEEAEILLTLCKLYRGHRYAQGAMTCSHTQINGKNPLRFFVINNGVIIINPLIINHTKVPTFQSEDCMAYPDKSPLGLVPRYNKIIVTFQTLIDPNKDGKLILSKPITEEMNGKTAQAFQHEISHLNGFNIYDEIYQCNNSIGFGDGLPVDPLIWNQIEESEIIEK
jgi:peptide deformylase